MFFVNYYNVLVVTCLLFILRPINAFTTNKVSLSPHRRISFGPARRERQSKREATVIPENESKKKQAVSPRLLAVQALIEKKSQSGKAADLSPVSRLESNPDFLSLPSQRDKSFARLLVTATMRRLGQIDAVLSYCCNGKYPPSKGKYAPVVQACLRLGAAQLLFLDTPNFAAVKETVGILKTKRYKAPEAMVKFTNAILRRLGREGQQILQDHTNPTDNISRWLLSEWTETHGVPKTLLIIQQLLDENAHNYVDLSLKGRTNEEVQFVMNAFKDFGLENIQELPNGSLRVKRSGSNGQISKWPLYDEGKWWIQDVSSTLPALAMISTMRQKFGSLEELTVVDMCAAPGGKTSQLLSAGFGSVVAVEASKRRCRRLEENLNRLGLKENCDVVVSNGQDWVPSDRQINGILLDVPCSATGTGNRRPDVLQKDDNLGNLIDTQESLAKHCVSILPPGGVLIYATCSLLARESEDQVSKLLEEGNVETLPFFNGEIPGFNEAIDENGWLRVLPGVIDGDLKICDGFFVARLLKK